MISSMSSRQDCREISAVEILLPHMKISIRRFHVLQIIDRQVSSKGKDVKEIGAAMDGFRQR